MIGIIPAAGYATRINGIAKYLLPTPDGILIDVLSKRLAIGGADRILIGVGAHSTDILKLEGRLLYTVNTKTMSETVAAASHYFNYKTENILFGMPDSYWQDDFIYQRLALDVNNGALVSVALFGARPEQTSKLGMCAVKFDGEDLLITQVRDKPDHADLHLAWGALAWSPDFWQYVRANDPHVGYALQRAVGDQRRVNAQLAIGPYFDCGTPDEYFACIRYLTGEAVAV